MKVSDRAEAALHLHMKQYSGQLLTSGTFAGDTFDRLYMNFVRARWDECDPWARDVWKERP